MIRMLSFGGGIQTSYLLFNYPERYDFCVFADVSKGTRFDEKAKTYWFIDNYIKPFCEKNGIEFITVHPKLPLFKFCIIRKIIPSVEFRWCTADFKIEPIMRFIRNIKQKGEVILEDIGFSYDEYWRAGNLKIPKYVKAEFPLVDDKITREQCKKSILDKIGFLPPKSSCVYCPYETKSQIRQNIVDEPLKLPTIKFMEKNNSSYPRRALFNRVETIRGKKIKYGIPIEVLVGSDNQKLEQWFGKDQMTLGCETGQCFV